MKLLDYIEQEHQDAKQELEFLRNHKGYDDPEVQEFYKDYAYYRLRYIRKILKTKLPTKSEQQ